MKKKNLPVYIITTSIDEAVKNLGNTPMNAIPVLKCDYTVIRTAARTKPAMYLLKEGTILNKWSYNRFGDAVSAINGISSQPVKENIAQPRDTTIKSADSTNHRK